MIAALYFPESAYWVLAGIQREPVVHAEEVAHMNTLETEPSGPLEVDSQTIDETETAEERAFVDAMVALSGAQRAELDENIRVAQQKLRRNEEFLGNAKNLSRKARRRHVRKYSYAHTDQIRLRGRLERLLAERGEFDAKEREKWQAQYRDILDIPRVLGVYVENERVVLRTDVLFGKDRVGAWHRIGPYLTSCNALSPTLGTIYWINLDGPKKVNDGPSICWGPPNIFQTGADGVGTVGCPGDEARREIESAARKRNFVLLAKVVVRYPECPGGQHNRTMQFWPIVPASEVPQWYIDTFGA